MNLETLTDILHLNEDCDLEFKASQDKLSKDIWETISAFANTKGGYIILGISEKKQGFIVTGVKNPIQQKKDFFNGHNNPQKLSSPICGESNFRICQLEEKDIIIIEVPPAERSKRPVYINNNPMTGTYKRNFEGDYHCSENEVRQMLRDASREAQDSHILENFNLDDLDAETIKIFRQRFSNREPDHPWLSLDNQELLRNLGGYKKDRKTGKEGLTIAGLLMFGKETSILEAYPYYHLDYQEKFSSNPDDRWTDRVTLDGTWEGNLLNFYSRVYRKLINDLNVPFQLDEYSTRQGETHVHDALREALVNSLIHADYSSTKPLEVLKYKNLFVFINPGRLRIPINQLYEGGISEPRNPSLQKMFQMIGLGEKAGSGFPKILRAWQEQQWADPMVKEDLSLEMTHVFLPMISLIPEQVETELRQIVGNNYSQLKELDRIALVLAHKLGRVSNRDVQLYSSKHPRDIGDCLKQLADNRWLQKSGQGKGTYYSLPNQAHTDLITSHHDHLESSSDHLESSSDHLESSSDHLESSSDHWTKLMSIAQPIREKGKVPKELMEQAIQELCQDQFLTQKQLAQLLNRSPHTLRTGYLTKMVQNGILQLRYPGKATHPDQGYRTSNFSNSLSSD